MSTLDCVQVVRYCIVCDGDGHHYVVPALRQSEFHNIVQAIGAYWDRLDSVGEESSCPEIPDWAEEIGGSPSLVEFEHYVIR